MSGEGGPREGSKGQSRGGGGGGARPCPSPSLFVSIWRKIFSVLFSGVDSSSGIFITDETIL